MTKDKSTKNEEFMYEELEVQIWYVKDFEKIILMHERQFLFLSNCIGNITTFMFPHGSNFICVMDNLVREANDPGRCSDPQVLNRKIRVRQDLLVGWPLAQEISGHLGQSKKKVPNMIDSFLKELIDREL